MYLMDKRLVRIAIGLVIVVGVVFFVLSGSKSRERDDGVSSGGATPAMSGSPEVQTPDPNANIVVSSPRKGEKLEIPFKIIGQARVFENQLAFRVLDVQGRVIREGIVTAQSPDVGQFGPFEAEVSSIANFEGGNATIEVFSHSAMDGSVINKVSLPVTISKENTQIINIFLGKNDSDCSEVFAIPRLVATTEAPGRVALTELLGGPTSQEKSQGFFSSINAGVSLQSLTITNGVARVDFSPALDEGVGGSCRVTAIRSQITNTLKQFPTVKEVIISINGRTQDILQP